MGQMAGPVQPDGSVRVTPPITPEHVAAHVRAALDAADLAAFADLLSPDVHWGAPGDANPPCQNRDQASSGTRKAGRPGGARK
jgi:hypothetical protein